MNAEIEQFFEEINGLDHRLGHARLGFGNPAGAEWLNCPNHKQTCIQISFNTER